MTALTSRVTYVWPVLTRAGQCSLSLKSGSLQGSVNSGLSDHLNVIRGWFSSVRYSMLSWCLPLMIRVLQIARKAWKVCDSRQVVLVAWLPSSQRSLAATICLDVARQILRRFS